MALLALWTAAGSGCFRATGLQRNPTAAEVLPETGGDKVLGLKSKGGAGELYLGNDFIQVAIDSTPYGDTVRTPIAGAASGGSIIDAGYILLDGSYGRVSMPGNAMNRLTPVVNQDPRMQIVFDRYLPVNGGETASILMTGGVLDAAGNQMSGVAVEHRISVALLDRFFTLSTTVTNGSRASVPIRNIGDALIQQGGGYAFNVPANFNAQGVALAAPWGVQIPGSNFANPLQDSVQAPMVGLMDTEPGADTVDSHCSLGILPVNGDQLLVAADAQDLLTVRTTQWPQFPARLVAGSLGASSDLAAGASLTYTRRLYIVGGTSVAASIVAGLNIAAPYPNQATGLFNLMDTHRFEDATLHLPQDTGTLTFTLSGMSQRQGPAPTEIRIERDTNALPGSGQPAPVSNWQLQRVEWFEPNENLVSQTALAPSTLQVKLPVGIYRMVLTSPGNTQTRTLFRNLNAVASPDGSNQQGTQGPIWIQKGQHFAVSPEDILSPDAAPDPSPGVPNNAIGAVTNEQFSLHYFTTSEANAPAGNLQPLRITFLRTDQPGANPLMRRMRTLATFFDPGGREPQVAAGSIPGQFQFRAGNEMFGGGFTRFAPAQFAWFANGGDFTALGTRGPLEGLQTVAFKAFPGQPDTSHTLTFFPRGLPPQWTSFDLPGPGQATTGGYLPGEKLASALANGVQVVGHTERDLLVNANVLYDQFRRAYSSSDLSPATLPSSLSAATRPPSAPYGVDPFVVAGRTTQLALDFGEATALFTPDPSNASLGGALVNPDWTLADFLVQAQGKYNVVHRPRGPQGLFTLKGVPVSSNPNKWWIQKDALTGTRAAGDFDALELLRGEGVDSTQVAAWFTEFKAVRSDWFALLEQQAPAKFTKALGLSSAKYSLDTPVGLARTYLKTSPVTQADLTGVLAALKSGAAVASTGPFLDVKVGTAGPGQTVPGPVSSVTLTVNLWKTDWMPVDELRVIVNGVQVVDPAINLAALQQSGADPRLFTGSFNLTLPLPARDSWIVVEAGVPLAGPTIPPANPQLWDTWNAIMRNIYPIAVTNPIFVDVLGDGYPVPPSAP